MHSHPPYPRPLKVTFTAALLLVMASCAEPPQSPQTGMAAINVPALARSVLSDVPAVTMDVPPVTPDWERDDASLVAALQAQDGHAVIAFKLPESPRTIEARGRRARLPAQAFQAGLNLVGPNGADIRRVYAGIGGAWIKIPPDLGPVLRRHPMVDYIEPRLLRTYDGIRSEPRAVTPMLASMVTQRTPWGISLIQAPAAWSYSTGAGVKVLTIDTGINPHEDLPSIPPENCGGGYGGCDDGPTDWHGTHVAGTMLGLNNTIGVVGVAPGIAGSLVNGWGACDSASGDCFSTEVIAGIDHARNIGAKVVNMSLGGPVFSQGEANAVAQAWAVGDVVLIASAGNLKSYWDPYTAYPAAYTNVVAVSGVKPDKNFADSSPCPDEFGTWRSNWGMFVDLSAPFWALSTTGTSGYSNEAQGYCGTSMAAPHVSGVAALVRARNPSWGNNAVVNHLYTTAEDRGAWGADHLYGYGVVNALAAASNPPPPSPTAEITWGPNEVRPNVTCSWEGTASGGTPPYTFEWHVNSVYAGSGTYFEYTNSGSTFTLKLTVRDAANGYGSTSRTVIVSSSAPACFL